MERLIFEKFVDELKSGNSKCLIVRGEKVYRFNLPGVKALMLLLKDEPETLINSFVFDKIIGKGAAALMILGQVKEIYGEIVSDNALALLEKYDLPVLYGKKVSYIENRTRSGLCPIENLSLDSDDPEIIYNKIKEFFKQKE